MDRKAEPRQSALWPLLLGDCLTALLLLAGGLFGFLTAYGVETDFRALGLACALMAPLSVFLWSLRKGGRIVLGLAAAWNVLLLAFWERLGPVLGYLDGYVRNREPFFHPSSQGGLLQPPAAESLLPALMFLSAALALLLGWLVVRARCWYLAAALVLAPLLPALAAGTLPNWWALLAGTLGWGTLLLTALFSPRDRRSLGRATLLSQGSLAALLLVLTLALPMEGYRRPQWATDARRGLLALLENGGNLPDTGGDGAFSRWLERMGLRFGVDAGGQDAAGGVDLRAAGPRRYTGRTVLRVSTGAPEPEGRVYLRGSSAGIYTGGSWEEVDEASLSGGVAAYMACRPAAGGQGTASTMTIRHEDASGTAAYYPYRLQALASEGLALAGGGAVEKTAGLAEYRVDYLPGGPDAGLTPVSTGWDPEQEYRDFAYDQYLQIPDGTRQVLEPLLAELERQETAEAGAFPPQHQEAVAAAWRTAKLLSTLAVYDLDVPAMGDGEDFAAHFLAQGRGYCVHFATLGALLLRLEGVPARYVSGYVADLDAGGGAVVRDSAAHAWVEIYLDGYGWCPVEMTPGYLETAAGGGDQTVPPEDPDIPEDLGTPEDPETPPSTRPDAPEDPGVPPEHTAPAPSGGPVGPEREPADLTWLWRTAGILLIPALFFALYRAALLWRRRRRAQQDANRAAVAAYRRYRRLLRWGCGEDGTLEELARKARFSQHKLTEEERRTAWARLEELAGRTERALPVWKRWCFRLLRPVF